MVALNSSCTIQQLDRKPATSPHQATQAQQPKEIAGHPPDAATIGRSSNSSSSTGSTRDSTVGYLVHNAGTRQESHGPTSREQKQQQQEIPAQEATVGCYLVHNAIASLTQPPGHPALAADVQISLLNAAACVHTQLQQASIL